MKKIKVLILSLIISFSFTLFIVRADDVKYGNLITDDTSIADDFKLLGININEYYKPNKYNYNKWYVIAMSEAYVDDVDYDIQTYFYLYNPVDLSDVRNIDLECVINDEKQTCYGSILSYDSNHLIYKIKGFVYDFCSTANIKVLKINYNHNDLICESDFIATANHSKLNGFDVELSFNTLLVLEEYCVVPVEIEQDGGYWDKFISCLTHTPEDMYVYFYNFNFPDHIEYDDVIFAKFEYDKVKYNLYDFESINYHKTQENELIEVSREYISESYTQKSNILKVNDRSTELAFSTFYLGNRIKDKQFGELDLSKHIDKFNYDCSILLGSTYKYRTPTQCTSCKTSINMSPCCQFYEYDQMEEIEILELHYTNDGIIYKCQVGGGNLSPGDPGYEDPINSHKPTWWEKFIAWLNEQFGLLYEKFKPIIWIVGVGCGLILFYWLIRGLVSIVRLVKDISNLRK